MTFSLNDTVNSFGSSSQENNVLSLEQKGGSFQKTAQENITNDS